MNYVEKVHDTVKLDELFAGNETPVRVENVSLKSGAEFSRGCILAGASGVFEPVSAAADAKKVLVIAAEDAASDTSVATVYTSGNFNLQKLSTASSVVSAADLVEPLRQVDIILSGLVV